MTTHDERWQAGVRAFIVLVFAGAVGAFGWWVISNHWNVFVGVVLFVTAALAFLVSLAVLVYVLGYLAVDGKVHAKRRLIAWVAYLRGDGS